MQHMFFSRFPVGRAFLSFLLVLAIVITVGCEEKKAPEEEIRELLDRGVTGLEANQLSEVVALLSEEYLDSAGRNYKKMKSLAFIVLRRGPVMVFLSDVEISVQGIGASVKLKATALQGQKKIKAIQDVLPKNARKMTLTLQVLKEGSDWKITAIDGDGFGASF